MSKKNAIFKMIIKGIQSKWKKIIIDGEECEFMLCIERTANSFGTGSFNIEISCENSILTEAIYNKIMEDIEIPLMGISNERYDIIESIFYKINNLPYFCYLHELPEETYGSGLGTILRKIKYK